MSDRLPSAPAKRVAIISTPRTGNTWLRHLLSRIWSLEPVALHNITDDDWAQLPRECVLQLHWQCEPEFVRRLETEGFRVISMARHPLDVLISILHVSVYGVDSERWLGGWHDEESALWGVMPCSRSFTEYATGRRARALFQVTDAWWQTPGTIRLRYEDLVAAPAAVLQGLEPLLGPPRGQRVEDAIRETSIANLRAVTGHKHHFWLGRSGMWRELLPAAQANEIAAALRSTFDLLNYACDPDPELTESQADAAWNRYFGHELKCTLNRYTDMCRSQVGGMMRRLEDSNEAMKEWEARFVGVLAEKQLLQSQRDAANRRLEEVEPLVAEAVHKLPLIEGCGRFALRSARFVQTCMNRVARLRRRRPVAEQPGYSSPVAPQPVAPLRIITPATISHRPEPTS
jgi:hypothetical protein